VLIQLAQCWFPGLAISNAKMYIFSNKIYRSNVIKQHSMLIAVLKKKFTVLFTINFGTLSFPIGNRCIRASLQRVAVLCLLIKGHFVYSFIALFYVCRQRLHRNHAMKKVLEVISHKVASPLRSYSAGGANLHPPL